MEGFAISFYCCKKERHDFKMKKGIRGHDVLASGLENIAARCRETGIEYLQLVLEKSVDGFEAGNFSEDYAKELKSQIGDMKIAVLGSYINPSSPDEEGLKYDLFRFKEKIRYATILNPIVVGTETGCYIEGLTYSEEAYQHLLKSVKELVEEAEKYDVNIGIEGVHVFVIDTPQKMKRLMDDLNSDNARVIFDPINLININNYKEQDKIINDMFNLLADKIAVIHAKDFVLEDEKIKTVAPGEGMLNYELIFKNLKEHSLDIPVIVEEFDENKAVTAFEYLEKIRRNA